MSKSLLVDCNKNPVDRARGDAEPTLPSVPKEYVHLHSDAAVLLTGWSALGGDRYTVTARWPEDPARSSYDPVRLTQTIRQACLLIAHAERAVPLSHQTLMDRMDFSVDPGHRIPYRLPVDLTLALKCESTGRRSLHVRMAISLDGRQIADSLIDFSWIAPTVYSRVRGEYRHAAWGEASVPAPIPAHTVGRASASDVVLAPTDEPDRWQLRVDVGNKALYDHPVDHVPGLVLIEAAYQAAHALTGPGSPVPHVVTSAYDRYVEFDAPCWMETAVTSTADDGRRTVEVRGVQNGETAFRMTLA
ncbi:ScbA/BarX family gamma-butyrolactone biosynthesis protein [Streptomyces griseus]|uniref:ScbA/BarX family gamma-butyrolactone biosynthesis protein n=1 Tax=Streptomyces griseus TaxID=1911 RepID=UPI0036AA8197